MKNTSTSIITGLVFSFLNTFSQAPVQQWDADFGGNDDEQFATLQQTKDGGYIAGGYSSSGISGDKTQDTRGSSDYWVVKTDSNGVKQWDARYGGNSIDQLTCLQQTRDGGYILGGISFSDAGGDKTQASQGNSDYWVVKINANGKKQWDATFGGTGPDELHTIEQTIDGGYILGGASFSNTSGNKTQDTKGGKDFWVVKINARGKKQWDADFGGNKFEELFTIQQSTDGGYIMGGYSLSGVNGDKTDPSRGRYDYWIVKTNAIGVKQWDATYGGKDDDWLTQIRKTKGGGYILGGHTSSNTGGDKTQDSKGFNDYWIVKTNADGTSCNIPTNLKTTNITADAATLKWDNVSGVINYYVSYRIAGSLAEWTTVSATGNFTELHDLFPGTPYEWKVRSVCNAQKLITSPWSVKQTFTTVASSDAIAKTISGQGNILGVNPNPVSQSAVISFSLAKTSPVRITISDVNGRILRVITEENYSEGKHKINFSRESLTAGMYYLQLKTDTGVMMKKFIIE